MFAAYELYVILILTQFSSTFTPDLYFWITVFHAQIAKTTHLLFWCGNSRLRLHAQIAKANTKGMFV